MVDDYTCGQSKGGSGNGMVCRGALCHLGRTRLMGGVGAHRGVMALCAQYPWVERRQ